MVPPVVKFLQAAGGRQGMPAEAQASSLAGAAPAAAAAAVGSLLGASVQASATAALQLLSMYIHHAWSFDAAGGSILGQGCDSGWEEQLGVSPVLLATAAQQAQVAGGAASTGAAGVQQQVLSLLSHVARQHPQPEVYCLEAEVLARPC